MYIGSVSEMQLPVVMLTRPDIVDPGPRAQPSSLQVQGPELMLLALVRMTDCTSDMPPLYTCCSLILYA